MNQAQTDYARQMTYAPSGAPASWNQGPAANSFTREWKYNSRMQTTQLHASGASGTLLTLALGYGEANHNGNLRDQVSNGIANVADVNLGVFGGNVGANYASWWAEPGGPTALSSMLSGMCKK